MGLTLARPASVEGIGLFTEARARVTIAPARSGITLTRSGARAPATIHHLSAETVHPAFRAMPPRNSNLALPDGSVVFTVEHILSALAGLGITAADIQIEGPELPIDDGSASLFTNAIADAGLTEIEPPAAPPSPEAFLVGDPQAAHIRVTPAQQLTLTFRLDYGPTSPIGPQSASWDGSPDAYARDIAPARTYCLKHEADAMHAAGLFKSFSPADLLVIGPTGPIENALRFDNEPARHKLLDLIGDLALAGIPLPPIRVEAFGSGHALNHAVARRLRGIVNP